MWKPVTAIFSREVDYFIEKPDHQTAESFIEAGNYLWNSGMFLFKASVFLEEISKFAPDIIDCCAKSLIENKDGSVFTRLNEEVFSQCPSDSIDYAVGLTVVGYWILVGGLGISAKRW